MGFLQAIKEFFENSHTGTPPTPVPPRPPKSKLEPGEVWVWTFGDDNPFKKPRRDFRTVLAVSGKYVLYRRDYRDEDVWFSKEDSMEVGTFFRVCRRLGPGESVPDWVGVLKDEQPLPGPNYPEVVDGELRGVKSHR